MTTILNQTAAAATFAAASLQARAGRHSVLATASVEDIAQAIAELAHEHEGNVFAASSALQYMDAAEQLEVLGLADVDEKSYAAAMYGFAA